MKQEYPYYPWSIRTLDRRLRNFEIYYTDKNVTLSSARDAIATEMKGPGRLLGYRAMQNKLRQKYNLKIPRDRTYDLMYDIHPDILENRRLGLKKRRGTKHFTTKGPNWVFSVDGHDKLMGYQNSTFPLAIYGCVDTASRKLLWLRIWTSKSKPELVARWYLEYLYETRTLPAYIRMDCGTETGIMGTIQAYLRQHHNDLNDPVDSIIYGPSTSNQVLYYHKLILCIHGIIF